MGFCGIMIMIYDTRASATCHGLKHGSSVYLMKTGTPQMNELLPGGQNHTKDDIMSNVDG